jgi:hypothetical protein
MEEHKPAKFGQTGQGDRWRGYDEESNNELLGYEGSGGPSKTSEKEVDQVNTEGSPGFNASVTSDESFGKQK